MKSNFHTHTLRCNHAVGAERDYVECAAKAGFEILGMSDHTPWPGPEGVGMKLAELPDYVNTLRALRNEYADRLTLKIGLECEYSRKHISWLRDTKAEMLDYIIMGNHFTGSGDEIRYFGGVTDAAGLNDYLKATVEGLETGLYSYLAHPELCLRAYPQWDKAAADVCRELARACRDLNVPVEYNLEGVRASRKGNHPGICYPNRHFWDIAAEEGCIAIIGYDAHIPETLLDDSDWQVARRLIDEELQMKRIETIFP